MVKPINAFLYQLGFVCLSMLVAMACYIILPASTANGKLYGFNIGGGIAAFIVIYLLLYNTFKSLISLSTANIKLVSGSKKSDLFSDKIEMINIGMEQKFTKVFWDDLIENSISVVDIFSIYSGTWLNEHISSLRKFLSTSGTEANFFLLDPESTATQALQSKFDHSGEPSTNLKDKISNSISRIQTIIDGDSKGKIRIYLQSFPPAYAAYRFDNRIVVVYYKQTPRRTNEIPAFIYSSEKNKGLFDYYKEDIESFKGDNLQGTNYSKLHWKNYQ